MAERSIANLRSFGDMDSDVFIADLGAVEPTGKEALGTAPWDGVLGWLGEDGAEEGLSVDVTKFKLFQGGKTGRTKNNGTEKTMQVTAAESNPLVFELFYGSQKATVTAGVAKIDVPDSVPTIARAVSFLFADGDIWYIRHNTRAEISDRGSVTYSNSDLSLRQMTFELVGKDSWLTNDPAFVGVTP